jgi:hypothetical protein
MRRALIVVAIVGAGLAVFALARAPQPTASDIEVTATIVALDPDGAIVSVTLDTHTVDLDVDLGRAARLTVGGVIWPTLGWDGDEAGGHHRSGRLRFRAEGPARDPFELRFDGLTEPLTLTWEQG